MASLPASQVTQLLMAAGKGDRAAAERVWTTVYQRLHRIAQGLLGREPTLGDLQPTGLIGELWRRLDLGDVDWANRDHFFAVVTKVMRRVIAEEARGRKRLKRNRGRGPLPLDEEPPATSGDHLVMLAVSEALEHLEQIKPHWARIVQLRFFEGMSVKETAEAMGVCEKTVTNGFAAARACLYKELSPDDRTGAARSRV